MHLIKNLNALFQRRENLSWHIFFVIDESSKEDATGYIRILYLAHSLRNGKSSLKVSSGLRAPYQKVRRGERYRIRRLGDVVRPRSDGISKPICMEIATEIDKTDRDRDWVTIEEKCRSRKNDRRRLSKSGISCSIIQSFPRVNFNPLGVYRASIFVGVAEKRALSLVADSATRARFSSVLKCNGMTKDRVKNNYNSSRFYNIN